MKMKLRDITYGLNQTLRHTFNQTHNETSTKPLTKPQLNMKYPSRGTNINV